MAPNISLTTGVLHENDDEVDAKFIPPEAVKPSNRKLEVIWKNVIFLAYVHSVAVYGLYLSFTSAKLATSIFGVILYHLSGLGIIAGVHRLWSHRSYKATLPLRLLLITLSTIAFQKSAIVWARDHRVHHKFSETDADPHNAKRGIFFAHMGWLMCRKHPDVISKGNGIDVSDLYADPILLFQYRYYKYLAPVVSVIIPTLMPMYLWNESFTNSFCVNALRFTLVLNVTGLVNSIAHLYGHRPYDRYINPAESKILSILTLGDGWHNYHHTFPWDYKSSELGNWDRFNTSAAFIEFFAKLGWAYDLKAVSEDMVKKRVLRTGDGSHEVWGWGDKDQPKEDYDDVIIINKKS